MIKGSVQQEGITIVNIFAPNIGAPQYIRQTLTDVKGEIDSNTIVVGVLNTPLTPMDRSSKQKINKETQVFNDTLEEWDLIDIFKTFHTNAEHIFFSSAMEHSPGQITSWVTNQTSVNFFSFFLLVGG